MLTGLVVFAIAVLRWFPETAVARWLRRVLVAPLGKITRTHLIFLVLMTVILIAGTEVLAMAGPFDMALVLVWDVSAYIDIALTTVMVASASRGAAGWRMVVARLLPRRGARARRGRGAAARKAEPANDDDGPRMLAVA
ncbi:hypothetical protein AB5I39_05140 [Sphingomonas sp. MMS24-J45]|uniref:hypothetical protein n=1 Tax=Sphingomonas sp. MMS24-J45 TaxID=3238806 RepID=UPI00384EC3E2